MSIHVSNWEHHLLGIASEAQRSHSAEEHFADLPAGLLRLGYQQAHQMTRLNSRTFFIASSLLPREKRRAVRALYAFCRVSDDVVDRAKTDPIYGLTQWRRLVAKPQTNFEHPDHPIALAWLDTRTRFGIPVRYAEQLLNGVAQDLHKTRYANFDELAHYCYGVACTVGLMSMHIVGYTSPEAFPYAIRLGVALQLTNILRDVGEDWKAGRLYLPQNELAAFDLTEADIAEARVTPQWRAFMRFQIDRNRRLYRAALPGLAYLHPDGRFAIGAAAELYQAILDEIEANDYDNFNHRAHLSTWAKLRRLPGIWWRSQNPQQAYSHVGRV